jgi:hypothetical protein
MQAAATRVAFAPAGVVAQAAKASSSLRVARAPVVICSAQQQPVRPCLFPYSAAELFRITRHLTFTFVCSIFLFKFGLLSIESLVKHRPAFISVAYSYKA